MQITLEIPDDIAQAAPLSEADWLREIAIALFQKKSLLSVVLAELLECTKSNSRS